MDVDEVEEVKVEEPEPRTFPDMKVAEIAFLLESTEPSVDVEAAKVAVMAAVAEDKMGPFYESLCAKHGWMLDKSLLASFTAANAEKLAALQATLKDAEENQGEMEVLDALFGLAFHFARQGDQAGCYKACDVIIAKPKLSSGKRIDASFCKLRMALFYMDLDAAKVLVASALKLVEEGGDWDRRNRLKAYTAVFLMLERNFSDAAVLLLEGVSTFTCVELCTYETYIKYAVSANLLYLERPQLKKQLVDGPDVVGVVGSLPPLGNMVRGLYDCEYAAFFQELGSFNSMLLKDRYLARHARYLVRECRIKVYGQFLEAYKSVMVGTMAAAFGVRGEFLDAELSRFIAAGKLNAKIDKVGGKVETNPPNDRNAQYQAVVKKGDLLLTNVQKLARVIDA